MKFALVAAAVAAVLGGLGAASATGAPHDGGKPDLCLLDPDACT